MARLDTSVAPLRKTLPDCDIRMNESPVVRQVRLRGGVLTQ